MSDDDPNLSERIRLVGGPTSVPPRPPALAATHEVDLLGLGPAFELASAELGFVAASWLFVDQIATLAGEPGIRKLRDELGHSFSVLDFVATEWLDGKRVRTVRTASIAAALEGIRRLVVVGLEARHLDALIEVISPSTRIGLVTYRLQNVDWPRVIGNYHRRIEPIDLATFQGWAGARSAILTFVYGVRSPRVNVLPAFLRVVGSDVRTQFRDIIGWNALAASPEVYPRYLVETLSSEFTDIVDETF